MPRFQSAGTKLNPIVAKVGGLQSQGAKGEAVVNLLPTLGNAGAGALRLSRSDCIGCQYIFINNSGYMPDRSLPYS